ncbi:dCTP deaminase domain-containing protein, partial [Enterococcus faecium]
MRDRMMSILVDHEIKQEVEEGKLIIEPYSEALIQPNSYDVRLADKFSWH